MNFADLKEYDYELPETLVRKKGIEPRDSARLFVYDTKTDVITHDIFSNLVKYLPEYSLLVLNDTRVIPARLHLKKISGGKIEVFVLVNEWDGKNESIPVLVDRKCGVGWKLFFPNGDFFEVIRQEENKFFVVLKSSNDSPEPIQKLLEKYGETPIPPYLKGEEWSRDEEELRRRYQTIFAKEGRSVAAPTAALHFTDRVFTSLGEKNIDTTAITLDVGLGTFGKLQEANLREKKLHEEWIEVSKETAEKINQTRNKGHAVAVVGTTALRTLESLASFGSKASKSHETLLKAYSGYTDIFITPPHHFQSADILITNFHIPKSSLMLLVDAFLQDKGAKRNLVELYKEAIAERYAFYSFGDSMLIL